MTADDWTFGLAVLGYGLLGADLACQHAQRPNRALSAAVASVVGVHVALVWHFRFDWSLSTMLEKSLLGALLFHSALLLIVLAPLLDSWRRMTTTMAFLLVTAGAVPAPFRYPELSLLQLPILAIAATSISCAVAAKRRTTPSA